MGLVHVASRNRRSRFITSRTVAASTKLKLDVLTLHFDLRDHDLFAASDCNAIFL